MAQVFNALIDRSEANPLIPEDVSREIVQGMPKFSTVMAMATRAPNMPRNQRRIPVLSTLPTAYFVAGDIGLKQTGEQAWTNKFFDAEELAVIVPIPEAVLADADYDIWGEIRPRIQEAMGVAFDQAVLYGVNAPSSWPPSVRAGAIAAGNVVSLATAADLYDDLLGPNGVISLVERDGFMCRGHIAAMSMRGRYRGIRDNMGQPIFKTSMQQAGQYDLDGAPIYFPENGSMIDTGLEAVLQFSGDFRQLVYAMRQDITYKILDQAVIQNAAGDIVYNLAQQDMVALRAVMRVAWQIPNPINRLNPSATRYPFGILTL